MCRERPMPAGDLSKSAGMSGPSVSEHLKVLRKTGLAKVQKQGKFWFYKTNMELLKAALSALQDELLNGEVDDRPK